MATESKQPEQITEQITEQMTKQVGQMFSLADMCRSQAEKATELWVSQSAAAVKESQKMTKEWLDTGKTLSDGYAKAYQSQIKDVFKMFTPAS